jgi:hypothetical protein
MSTLAANSIIGNNTAASATPIALNASQVKSILGLNLVENTTLSSWTGSSNLSILGTLNNLNVGFLNMNLGTLSSIGANSDLNISGAGTGVINALKTIKLSNGLSSTGTIAITPNGGASPVEIWGPLDMKTNPISNVGALTSGAINATTISASSTIFATGNIDITGSRITISPTAASADTQLILNGVTTSNARYITLQQGGANKITAGLWASSYYFIYDSVNNVDILELRTSGTNRVSFPTYTVNGSLSISGGALTSASDRRLKQNEEALNIRRLA